MLLDWGPSTYIFKAMDFSRDLGVVVARQIEANKRYECLN